MGHKLLAQKILVSSGAWGATTAKSFCGSESPNVHGGYREGRTRGGFGPT